MRDPLVAPASHHQIEHLPLAWRQCRHQRQHFLQPDFLATHYFMTRYSPLDCLNKVIRRYWFEQKILSARLDGLHRDSNIGMTREKNDWKR